LLGFGRSAQMVNLNYYWKDCIRLFITGYTYLLGSPLRLNIKQKIEFFVNVWVYRGLRFTQKLPMRGQNTRSNAKTIKSTVNFFNIKKY
jgi:ribosomal protein S13